MISISWYGWSQVQLKHLRRLVIVIQEQKQPGKTALIILDQAANKRTELMFSSDKKIPLAYGYGYYRPEVVPEFSQQENRGLELLHQSISNWMGIEASETLILPEISMYYSLTTLINAPSTLNFWERIWLWNQLVNIADTSIKKVDLELNEFLSIVNDSYQLDISNRNKLARDYFYDAWIAGSGHQIVIVNTTGTSGLASRTADMLIHLGFDVISLEDTRNKFEQSQIHVDSEVEFDQNYLIPLQHLFLEIKPERVEISNQYRGDVVIFLGQDYLEYSQ